MQQRAFEKHVQEKIDENARREYMNSQNYRDWVLKKVAENRLNQDEALENEWIRDLVNRYIQEA